MCNFRNARKILELAKISLSLIILGGPAIAEIRQNICDNVRTVEIGGRLGGGAAFFEVQHHPAIDGDVILFRSPSAVSDSGEVVTAVESKCDFRLELWRDLSRGQMFARLGGYGECMHHQAFSDPLDKLSGNSLDVGLAVADLDTGISTRGYRLTNKHDGSNSLQIEVFVRHLKSGLCLGDRINFLADVK